MPSKLEKREKEKKVMFFGIVAGFILVLATLIAAQIITGTIIIDDQLYNIIPSDGKYENSLDFGSKVAKVPLEILTQGFSFNIAVVVTILATLAIFSYLLWIIGTEISNAHIVYFALLSPFFLFSMLSYSGITLIMILTLVQIIVLLKKKYSIGILLQLVISPFSFSIGAMFFIITLYLAIKKQLKFFQSILFGVPLLFFLSFSIGTERITLETIIVEFGIFQGISLIIFFLAIIGMYLAWKDKKGEVIIAVVSIFFLWVSKIDAIIILNIVSIYFGAMLTNQLVREKWVLPTVKKISILLLVCIVLFTGLSAINGFLQGIEHNEELMEGLEWIKEKTNEQDIILTHQNYHEKINFFGKREVKIKVENEQNQKDVAEIWWSRNEEITRNLLDKYNINYIFITDVMKMNLIWSKEDQGLLFIAENDVNIKKVFENKKVTIYEYRSVSAFLS